MGGLIDAPPPGALAMSERVASLRRLVDDLPVRFLRGTPETLDTTIVECLCDIGEALALDVTSVWRGAADGTNAVHTHSWVRPSLATSADAFTVASLASVAARLHAGQTTLLPTAAFLPLPAFGSQRDALHAMWFGSLTGEREWPPSLVEHLQLAAAVIGQALARHEVDVALRGALDEVRKLSDGRCDESDRIRRSTRASQSHAIILDSPVVRRAFKQAECVAPMPATVLLLGETGSGKEVFAQAIHDLSPRHHRQMVKLNCAAIPSALIESELFGRERGAFTGALSRQVGRFEVANHSTLFLDEIGDLPIDTQVKLLRVLQQRVFERLGSHQSIKVDVRIIAATNRDLEKAVQEKTFREDLYYRLNVFPIVVPPLRERVEDIAPLVWAFVDEFSKAFGKPIDSISKESMRELQRYAWPGNIRELRNVVERAVILSTGRHLQVTVPKPPNAPPPTSMVLTDLELAHIRAVLDSTNWRVRGAGGAAERLGLKPTTLESRMAKLGIRRAPSASERVPQRSAD
jgi:DNA-binding NtrC family response regulator